MSEITRKLATIRRIDALTPIPDADKIEVATVGGWNVVAQKGLYEVGDLAVYFEIDSFIPTTVAPFLTKEGHYPKVFNQVEGERLKTVKLRGQLSQGLLIPLKELYGKLQGINDYFDGQDVTEILGIQKWEAPVPAQLAGMAKGNFPTAVPKTDQERIQNLKKELEQWKERGLTFEVTEKLEGSSCTMYLPVAEEDPFEVCSRNLSLKPSEENSFWKAAVQYNVEAKMRAAGLFGLALQGELIGEGIQGNIYKLKGQDFYVYDIYDVKAGAYLTADARTAICDRLGLKHSPVIDREWKVASVLGISDILAMSEGKSQLLASQEREGLVFKCIEDPQISMKAISNKYLLKSGA